MSRGKKLFGLLVSLLFLWLALRKVDWQQIPAILSQVQIGYLLILSLTLVGEVISRTYRWQVILQDRQLPFGLLFNGLSLGYFFNNLFPARAGEFARAIYISRRTSVRASEIFGSIILERFLDGIVVMGFLLITLTCFDVSPTIRAGGISAFIFYLSVFLFMSLFQFRRAWVARLLEFVLRPFPEGWRERVMSVQTALSQGFSLLRQPWNLLHAIFLSFIAWTISVLTLWCCLQAVNIIVGWRETILLITVLSLGAMIPSSPGMIGLYEYLCVLVLSEMLHYPHEVAITFGILMHILGMLFYAIIGTVILFRENLALKEFEKADDESDPLEICREPEQIAETAQPRVSADSPPNA
ncbi:MAG TPA: lysylphosphatidylglycerol synthase transmembrane domain-containing protein [Candidatus Ozemobacteraceae bacterium]|nr:lysylphosphatidylglycerol synthase transmembrane domain-containing protein [Candidatus Ozemobacteraceae bacterium]